MPIAMGVGTDTATVCGTTPIAPSDPCTRQGSAPHPLLRPSRGTNPPPLHGPHRGHRHPELQGRHPHRLGHSHLSRHHGHVHHGTQLRRRLGITPPPRALDRFAAKELPTELHNCTHCIRVPVVDDEPEAFVPLQPHLQHRSHGLEPPPELPLGNRGRKVSHVDVRVAWVGAALDRIIVERGRRGVLLPPLIGPAAPYLSPSHKLSIHLLHAPLRVVLLTECHKAVPSGLASVLVPHDARIGAGPEAREHVEQDVVIHLGCQVPHEDVVVGGGILHFVPMERPVHLDILPVEHAAIDRVHRNRRPLVIHEAHETVARADPRFLVLRSGGRQARGSGCSSSNQAPWAGGETR
mmetsp:Transcript_24153/g.75800  ORF Transcript_24153/g.75800 Transcript_24153/m.75800 type:complete len:351 (-) Transcript_24153:833-1885(-)